MSKKKTTRKVGLVPPESLTLEEIERIKRIALGHAPAILAAKKQLDKFNAWFENLTQLDRDNFITLVNLPHAKSLVAKMPVGEYKNMAAFGVAFVKAQTKGFCE